VISYTLAFLAAMTNAASNVVNRKATREEPAKLQFRLSLIRALLRRRTWLVAVALMAVSFFLSAAALGTGEIAAVQPIIVLELPMTLIGGSMVLGSRLGLREWGAVAALTAGLIGLLMALDPQPGAATGVSPVVWILASAANGSAILALFLAARHATRRPGREAAEAALLGVASGLGYGLAAAYTKGLTEQFSTGGIAAAAISWQLYAAAATGLTATWLLQNSYHADRLAAAQPGITLADPVVGVIWGILIFHERVRGAAYLGVAVIPLLMLAAGVFLLSRSPALQGPRGAQEGPSRDDGDPRRSGNGSRVPAGGPATGPPARGDRR
jgi:drug/metabolite transporter (DMT)-like permease